MMGSDARDVLGLPSAGPKPATPKVQKPKGRGPTGMIREVLDLKYEGAPPISIVAPKFKEKPKLPFKPRPWEETPFSNSARKDGLVLRHWRRKGDVVNGGAAMPVTPADSNAASEMEQDEKLSPATPDSYWAKYNVRVERPQYTDEQYETHLKSEDWSKEETGYLVDLATEFDLRWAIISDRYDYKPNEQPKVDDSSMALPPSAKPRTQEDIKARYYTVAAKSMVFHNPLSSMSSSEFDAHEKMTKYDPLRETSRKKYAEQLLKRTREETQEEEFLLRELSRIVSNQEKLSQERKALYDRLDAAPSFSRDSFSTSMYQSSQGLGQLVQTLMAQNRSKELERRGEKRRSLLESDAASMQSSLDRSHRHSLGGGPSSRLSTSQNLNDAQRPSSRPLSSREEAKYGVSHPNERLTGGVQFRHERVTKAGQAKSGVQTSRIGAALTELKIPPRLTMPTRRVVEEYERLVEAIKGLLEVRKISEKVEAEIKVWVAQKEQAEAKERGEEIKEEDPIQAVTEGEEDEDADAEGAKGEGEQNEDEEKVEDENDEDNEDENEDEEEKDEQKEDSDEEVNQDESENNNDDDEDADGDVDENAIADEMRELQEEDNGEGDEQDREEEDQNVSDEDADGENEDDRASSQESPAPTAKGEGPRKRSASVISHVSNRSAKRQKK